MLKQEVMLMLWVPRYAVFCTDAWLWGAYWGEEFGK